MVYLPTDSHPSQCYWAWHGEALLIETNALTLSQTADLTEVLSDLWMITELRCAA